MANPKSKYIKIGGAVVLALISATLLYAQFRGPATYGQGANSFWYYDLNTSKAYRSAQCLIPPVSAPSGPDADGKPAGVRAFVYACGSCRDAEKQPTYLEMFTADSKLPGRLYGALTTLDDNALKGARLVKKPADKEWTDAYSDEGKKIQAIPSCDDGKAAKLCD